MESSSVVCSRDFSKFKGVTWAACAHGPPLASPPGVDTSGAGVSARPPGVDTSIGAGVSARPPGVDTCIGAGVSAMPPGVDTCIGAAVSARAPGESICLLSSFLISSTPATRHDRTAHD